MTDMITIFQTQGSVFPVVSVSTKEARYIQRDTDKRRYLDGKRKQKKTAKAAKVAAAKPPCEKKCSQTAKAGRARQRKAQRKNGRTAANVALKPCPDGLNCRQLWANNCCNYHTPMEVWAVLREAVATGAVTVGVIGTEQ